jgi:aminopeptidase-like protein
MRHSELSTQPIDTGADVHRWATDLWPLNRSLTGDGVRATLAYLKELLPDLSVHEVPSGTQAFDWTVPDEWNLRQAWVEDSSGRRVIDTASTNLHVVGYSEPFAGIVSKAELRARLHTLPEQPDAIPYVTSYYQRTWGFCIPHAELERLGDGPFRVHVDTTLESGHLTYADLVIPGESTDEVLLSTYICHPSMANNELSGPVVTTALARWIASLPERRYTYRIVFIPETIGSILYLSRHLEHLRSHVRAGWVITCAGDDRTYSYVPSRMGGTLADRVSLQVLGDRGPFDEYTFLDRGSDERQWCSPGADLPVCSIMRSKYGAYPEYHTSLDDLERVVTPQGLQGGLDALKDCVTLLEANHRYRTAFPGEPQMGRRGLYPTTSIKGGAEDNRGMENVIAYSDGSHDVIDLCSRTNLSWREVIDILRRLEAADVLIRAREN